MSISGGLPPAARDLLVAFYRMWFPATHPLAESRRPYPASLPDVLAQFGGEDYNDDLARLEVSARQSRLRDPPLYKQYSEVCEPGGVQFIDFGSDPDFNNCVDGLVLVDLTYLKANRYQRYIGAHLGAQNRHKRFSRLAARCALAGLWFTVSDGSVVRKRRVRRRLREAAGNAASAFLRGSRLMP